MVKFKPNFQCLSGDEVNETIDNFDYSFKSLIVNDNKWDYGVKCDADGEWYHFNTKELEKMLVNVCKYFEIDGIIVENLEKVTYNCV